jgi:hypothetical protein
VGVDEQAIRGGEGGGGLLWVPSARAERRKWREGVGSSVLGRAKREQEGVLELNEGLGGEWRPRGARRRGRGVRPRGGAYERAIFQLLDLRTKKVLGSPIINISNLLVMILLNSS